MEPKSTKKMPQDALTKGGRFLFNLYWATYQALVDAAGQDRAIEIIKPYMKSHYDGGTQAIKTNFKLKTDDLYSIAVYLKLSYSLMGVIVGNLQFFDQGFTADVHYCPIANVSEALCILSERESELGLDAINSDYELVNTKMLRKGDPFCQVMVKKKGHTIWGEVPKKPVEIPIPHLSDEEQEYWESAVYSQMWIYVTNALVDFAGKDKAVDILRPYMRALGKSIAIDLSKELGIKDGDAISIASIIERCNQAAKQKGEYTIHTPGRVEKELTECIFAHASQDICADALEARSNGICEMINPEYEFRTIKRMCKGNKTCKWVIAKHQ